MDIFSFLLQNLVFVMVSALAGIGLFLLYNHFPPAWFMEYPAEKDGNRGKVKSSLMKKFPDGAVFISAFTAGAFIYFSRYGYSLLLICHILALAFLLLISASDFKTGIIPNQLVTGMVFTSLFWMTHDIYAVQNAEKLWYRVLTDRVGAGLIGALVIYLIGKLGALLLKKEAMGMGDVKFIFACGLVVDLSGILIVVILSFLLAFIPSVIRIIRRKDGTGTIPFGPFIAAATAIYLMMPDTFLFIAGRYGGLL